jgi:hypothetical protein
MAKSLYITMVSPPHERRWTDATTLEVGSSAGSRR